MIIVMILMIVMMFVSMWRVMMISVSMMMTTFTVVERGPTLCEEGSAAFA